MKRLLLGVAIVCGAAFLGGCPIYSTTGDYPACGANGNCFDCPNGSTPSDGTCIPLQCSSASDCPSGYACSANRCVPAPDAGDCSGGCQSGYVCRLSGGVTQCVPVNSVSNDAGSAPSQGGQSADAVAATDAGHSDGVSNAASSDGSANSDGSDGSVEWMDASYPPDVSDAPRTLDSSPAADVFALGDSFVVVADASDASDASLAADASNGTILGSCNASGDCGGGAKCIDGHCMPSSQLCSDSTQCIVAGESCVDGVCEPHCSASAPCPGGYECDFTHGVCNINPGSCSGSGACQGGGACVEGHCVPPCALGDTGPTCPVGQVCVNGGCIPDEAAQFGCKNDGKSGQLATSCGASAVCLHHDCYAECDPDAGAAACADPAAVCKQVTVAAGTYLVCATPTNLGSDCDPAAGRYCAGAVCIDGYCR